MYLHFGIEITVDIYLSVRLLRPYFKIQLFNSNFSFKVHNKLYIAVMNFKRAQQDTNLQLLVFGIGQAVEAGQLSNERL